MMRDSLWAVFVVIVWTPAALAAAWTAWSAWRWWQERTTKPSAAEVERIRGELSRLNVPGSYEPPIAEVKPQADSTCPLCGGKHKTVKWGDIELVGCPHVPNDTWLVTGYCRTCGGTGLRTWPDPGPSKWVWHGNTPHLAPESSRPCPDCTIAAGKRTRGGP